MARQKKRQSPQVTKAKTRVAALTSIDAELDLGEGLTLKAYKEALQDTEGRLDGYNTALSQVDGAFNALRSAEKKLADLSERMLTGVASRYGKDSDEYEKAGGVRKSEHKRPVRTKKGQAEGKGA